MTFLAALALLAPATNPDPKALAPTADQLAAARGLVRQLGSPDFREREAASRALERLNRIALPALAEAAASNPDPEVRTRVELLRPKAEAADRQARLAAFRADTDGKFDHALPGWTTLRERAGDSADARALYLGMWDVKANADLLAALDGPPERLGRRLDARRAELYRQHVQYNGNLPRVPPRPADLAALLLLDGLAPPPATRGYNPTWSLLGQSVVRDSLNDDARPAFRRLLVGWLDARTDPAELYQAMSLAARLERKEMPPLRYAAKLLDGDPKVTPVFYRMYALTVAARDGKPALPVLAKGLTDTASTRLQVGGPNGQVVAFEAQVRDVALAMSLVALGEEPEKYGFENAAPGSSRPMYTQYRFPDDAARQAAFKKWAARK